MGRLIIAMFIVVAAVPAVILLRIWLSASGRRTIDFASLSFVRPTPEADASTARFTKRRSRSSLFGVLAALWPASS